MTPRSVSPETMSDSPPSRIVYSVPYTAVLLISSYIWYPQQGDTLILRLIKQA